MSKYNVGLNNVGSYQSSGRPFLKTVASLASGGTEYIKFDNVTKKIRVKNHSTSGKLKIGFADNARRAFDMPSNTAQDRFDGTLASSPGLSAVTVSFWYKDPSLTTPLRLVEFTGGGVTDTRLQGQNSFGEGGLRFRVQGNNANTGAGVVSKNTWHQVTIVLTGTDNKLYIDGNSIITNATTMVPPTGISFGDDQTANHDGIYDDIYVFNTALTAAEVLELYNEGSYFDPRDHSKSSNLQSWWAFEDNAYRTYFSTNDTSSTIIDRIGSNNLTAQSSGRGVFVPGRQLDTAINSHSIIIPAGGEIELSVKTKSMFLFADGATQNFDVYASLTNIPSGRMYDLTGAGIDA